MIERITVGSFAANCWLLPLDSGREGPGLCILVDPGAEADRILSLLDARSLVPSLIVCSHGHLDHICGIGPLVAEYKARGKRIPIAIHKDDASYLGQGGGERNRRLFRDMGASSFFDQLWVPVPEADILLEDASVLPESSWKVIHSPGHSRGSICLYEETLGMLISGDTLFRDGVGRTDGFDGSASELRESIVRKLFCLPAATKVFPGHGAPTTIGRERGD